MAGLMDKYTQLAPQAAGETPADTIPEGEYPAEVIGAKFAIQEGTAQATGRPYRFANGRVQIKVLDGPMKGQTTWIDPPLTLPDNEDGRLEDEQVKRFTYLTLHFYDASGFGKRFDPTWARSEEPNPKKPGKVITKFNGRATKAILVEIAESKEASDALAAMLRGCNGIWNLGTRTSDEGAEFQRFKSIVAMTDANLTAWRTKQASPGKVVGATSPTTSMYGPKPVAK